MVKARYHGTVREFDTEDQAHAWIKERAAASGHRLVISCAPGAEVYVYDLWNYDEVRDKRTTRFSQAMVWDPAIETTPVPVTA